MEAQPGKPDDPAQLVAAIRAAAAETCRQVQALHETWDRSQSTALIDGTPSAQRRILDDQQRRALAECLQWSIQAQDGLRVRLLDRLVPRRRGWIGPTWRRLRGWLAPRLGSLAPHAPRPLEVPRRYARAGPPDNAPAISLATPSFNQATFLERTIKSVLEQGYPRLEYLLQDGGSTDGSCAILDRYRSQLHRAESKRDQGQAHAVNLAFRHTSGEIMGWLNSDDLLLPGALCYVGTFFARHPKVDVIYGHRVLLDEGDREVGRWVLPPHDGGVLAWADYVPQETLFWRRRVWDRVGGALDESFQFAMDWDLILRFQEAGARFVRVPRFLGAFRLHAGQKTSAWMADRGQAEMDRLRRRCHGRPVSRQEVHRHVRPYLRLHVLYQKLYRAGLLRY